MSNSRLYNMDMVRGDTLSFGFETEGVDNLDTAFFTCKKNADDSEYLFQKSFDDGIYLVEPGKYGVRVAPEDTENMNPGTYYYDVEIGVNGDIFTILKGQLKIVQDITIRGQEKPPITVEWGNITGELSTQIDLQAMLNTKANVLDLAFVATSNNYEDLDNKPSIPTKTSELTNDSDYVVSTSLATVAESGSYNDLLDRPNIVDLVYPVGSYYWSANETDPGTIFGVGTWTQITNKFLFAAGGNYSVGDTGGEEKHQLTVNEMPAHWHRTTNLGGYAFYGGSTTSGGPASGNGYFTNANTLDTSSAGGSQSHNNMPPYLVAYCWRRDA